MKLLTADEVKNKKQAVELEQKERMDKLAQGESSIVKRLNSVRIEVKQETERIKEEFVEFKKQNDIKKQNLESEIKQKLIEIEKLENRKTEALRPITTTLEKAKSILEDAERREQLVYMAEIRIAEKESIILDEIEDLVDKKDELDDRESKIGLREIRLKNEEDIMKKSSGMLSDKWLEFHKAVIDKNDEFAKKERAVENAKKANESYKKTLEEVAKKQEGEWRLIRDQRGTLDRAWKELERKKNDKR